MKAAGPTIAGDVLFSPRLSTCPIQGNHSVWPEEPTGIAGLLLEAHELSSGQDGDLSCLSGIKDSVQQMTSSNHSWEPPLPNQDYDCQQLTGGWDECTSTKLLEQGELRPWELFQHG